jgi:hypothetical protein
VRSVSCALQWRFIWFVINWVSMLSLKMFRYNFTKNKCFLETWDRGQNLRTESHLVLLNIRFQHSEKTNFWLDRHSDIRATQNETHLCCVLYSLRVVSITCQFQSRKRKWELSRARGSCCVQHIDTAGCFGNETEHGLVLGFTTDGGPHERVVGRMKRRLPTASSQQQIVYILVRCFSKAMYYREWKPHLPTRYCPSCTGTRNDLADSGFLGDLVY